MSRDRGSVRCALCRQRDLADNPAMIYARNPNTFRLALMHRFCLSVALESLREEPANSPEFQNRYDEYINRE